MPIKRMHTNIGLAVITLAALAFGATGFLTAGNAAVGRADSCAPGSNFAASASAAGRGAAAGSTETNTRTDTNARQVTATDGTGSGDGTITTLLAEIQRLSSSVTPAATAQVRGLLAQVLALLSANAIAVPDPSAVVPAIDQPGGLALSANGSSSENGTGAAASLTTPTSETGLALPGDVTGTPSLPTVGLPAELLAPLGGLINLSAGASASTNG